MQKHHCNKKSSYLTRISNYNQDDAPAPFLEHYARIHPESSHDGSQNITIVSEDLKVLQGKHVLVRIILLMFLENLKVLQGKHVLVRFIMFSGNLKVLQGKHVLVRGTFILLNAVTSPGRKLISI
jgi:hypothetical protein